MAMFAAFWRHGSNAALALAILGLAVLMFVHALPLERSSAAAITAGVASR